MSEQLTAQKVIRMKCGCTSYSQRRMPDGTSVPSCVVHDCIEIDESPPSLEGRQSCCRAMYGPKGIHDVQPSSASLPFFEYLGPGSKHAAEMCKCGYHKVAHDNGRCKCRTFTPTGPAKYDKHYCGCHGWD